MNPRPLQDLPRAHDEAGGDGDAGERRWGEIDLLRKPMKWVVTPSPHQAEFFSGCDSTSRVSVKDPGGPLGATLGIATGCSFRSFISWKKK